MMLDRYRSAGTCKRTKSADHGSGTGPDMLQFTIRSSETFYNNFDEYKDFPFDKLKFRFRFELSHFEIKDEENNVKGVFRFDFYPTKKDEILWKSEVDQLPELDIDFKHANVGVLKEEKTLKDRGGKDCKVFYYPGFIFEIATVRDPTSKMIRSFLPTILIDVFLHESVTITDLNERLANLGLCLLSFITLMD